MHVARATVPLRPALIKSVMAFPLPSQDTAQLGPDPAFQRFRRPFGLGCVFR